MSQEVKEFCNKIGSELRVLEEGTLWSNRAELFICLAKETGCKYMREYISMLILWDYCVEQRDRVRNLTTMNIFQLHGSDIHTTLNNEEGHISNLCQHS